MDIFIKKDILHDKRIDSSTMATYIAMRSIYTMQRSTQYVTVDMLCYELCGDTSYTKYMKQAINKGINTLAEIGYITILQTIGKSDYVIDMDGIFFDTNDEFFVVIANTEINKIFSLTGNIDKFGLLRYFACMIGTINNKDFIYTMDFEDGALNNFVGYQTLKVLSGLSGIPEKTCISYNSILESLALVYIYRHEKYSTDGEIKSLNNHYGRRCYAKYIKQFALEYEDSLGDSKRIIKAKKEANEKRSMTQKYNAFLNGAEYSDDELIDLYTQIHSFNYKCQRIIDGSNDEECIEKAKREIKDVTKLEEYLGINEELLEVIYEQAV